MSLVNNAESVHLLGRYRPGHIEVRGRYILKWQTFKMIESSIIGIVLLSVFVAGHQITFKCAFKLKAAEHDGGQNHRVTELSYSVMSVLQQRGRLNVILTSLWLGDKPASFRPKQIIDIIHPMDVDQEMSPSVLLTALAKKHYMASHLLLNYIFHSKAFTGRVFLCLVQDSVKLRSTSLLHI